MLRQSGLLARSWARATRYRRTRPFWGCVVLALGGWFVLSPVVGSFTMVVGLGMGGAQVYILGGGMIAAAAVALVTPAQRFFPALMALIFSVASLPLANLGGWLIGMVLGIVGSGMVFAWTPYTQAQLDRAASGRRGRRAAVAGTTGAAVAGEVPPEDAVLDDLMSEDAAHEDVVLAAGEHGRSWRPETQGVDR